MVEFGGLHALCGLDCLLGGQFLGLWMVNVCVCQRFAYVLCVFWWFSDKGVADLALWGGSWSGDVLSLEVSLKLVCFGYLGDSWCWYVIGRCKWCF